MTSPKNLANIPDNHEKYCKAYATTLSNSYASQVAKIKPSTGAALLRKPIIRERIDELQRTAGDHIVANSTRTLREIAYLAYSDITEIMHVRNPKDLKALPMHVRHAVKKLTISRKGEEQTVSIELHAKTEPLKLLALCTGLIQQGQNKGADLEDKPIFSGLKLVHSKKPTQ